MFARPWHWCWWPHLGSHRRGGNVSGQQGGRTPEGGDDKLNSDGWRDLPIMRIIADVLPISVADSLAHIAAESLKLLIRVDSMA